MYFPFVVGFLRRGNCTPRTLRRSMRRQQQPPPKMRCLSCEEEYGTGDAGTCKECHEDLKSKLAFLRFWSPSENPSGSRSHALGFSDVVLVASKESGPSAPVPAHRVILVS
ncbi:hypothetical protein CDL15_Pgr000024 [Punica granatum]|uniref:Uncharacterized protein n=1 Tax=Punica granatum TaxID=22663 RepID=A0A218VRF0_PUNGR|nr:hypothetical protein CDL15_Pgr000024 [Punica granatum]